MAMTAEKISAGREVGEGRGAVCIARLEGHCAEASRGATRLRLRHSKLTRGSHR